MQVSMSVLKTVQSNREEFENRLPAHGVEWAFADVDISWGLFRKLRDDSGDAVLIHVRDEGGSAIWMTSRALDECVREHLGDVLVEEV